MFPPRYHFSITEQNSNCDYWIPLIQNTKTTKTLLLPPPNITGNLHLGHALNSVLQDFLVRLSYLQKKPIKWIAGIDHAGIATQSKIEKLKLTELNTDEKKKAYTLQVWSPQNRKIFTQQWQKLGLLLDYEKASFTLDPTIQNQVKEAFIKLYQNGLIFCGKKLVNWDPQLQSVISDIEVEHRPTQSKLYYLKYPLLNNNSKTGREKNSNKNIKKEKISQAITSKSDIIISFDEEYLAPIINQQKTYEFRSWRTDPEVKRMWIYVNKPVQSLMYILEVDLPIEYPNQIPNENVYNEIFNRGGRVEWKFAYRIKRLYKLSEPVGVKKLKEKYRIHPPQKFTYVSKYPQLIKDVIVESQEKNTSFIRVIIQNKEGKILMIKEKKRGWMFPGGKIEEGETPEEAAKREVFEETNLVVKNLKKAKERAFFFDDRRIKNKQQKGYVYWTNEYSGEIQNKEPEKILDIKFMDKTSQEVVNCSQWWFFSSNELDYLKILDGEEEKLTDNYLLVATSRPETIFADVALLVNPHDKRYQKYIGQQVQHPVTKKIIPILAEEKVEIAFGTGVLKCTPGHDFTDYELGQKHQLPIVSCCDEKGILNELAGEWKGQKISDIRELLVQELVKKGICQKVENYVTNLAYSTKSGAVVEPLLSQQWFLDLPNLIKKIEQKQPNCLEKVNFLPASFRQTLENWKIKAREWCISRQLWWGHHIPAWHHKKTGEIYVGEELDKCGCVEEYKRNPKLICIRHKCSLWEWEPEKDVLDTWFSSGLWPLIALAQENDQFPSMLTKFYPITTLITGYDIIFFWVLKMILLGTYFTGRVPFQQVLLHGLIRDSQGRKMSKSLGNGVEPEEIITKYGCDSLRLFLLENNVWGSDLIYEESKIVGSWRFCQKLWSIANLLTQKIPTKELKIIKKKNLDFKNNNLLNHWILKELALCQKNYLFLMKENKYEIGKIITQLIKFTREKLSNDYLELVKISSWGENTKNTLLFVYQQLLLLLHPAIPFLTEYIYQKITQEKLLLAEIEMVNETKNHDLWLVDCLLLLIKKIRSCNKREQKIFYFELMPEWQTKYCSRLDFNQFLFPLTKSRIQLVSPTEKIAACSLLDINPFGVLKTVEKLNVPKNRTEDRKKIVFYQTEQQRSQKLLANKNFVERAPAWLVAQEKEKLVFYEKMLKSLLQQ